MIMEDEKMISIPWILLYHMIYKASIRQNDHDQHILQKMKHI